MNYRGRELHQVLSCDVTVYVAVLTAEHLIFFARIYGKGCGEIFLVDKLWRTDAQCKRSSCAWTGKLLREVVKMSRTSREGHSGSTFYSFSPIDWFFFGIKIEWAEPVSKSFSQPLFAQAWEAGSENKFTSPGNRSTRSFEVSRVALSRFIRRAFLVCKNNTGRLFALEVWHPAGFVARSRATQE